MRGSARRFGQACRLTMAAWALAVATGVLQGVRAADRYWDGGVADIAGDGDGVSAGGAGVWNTATTNWDAGTGPHVAWNNAGLDTAILGGTGGVVTLEVPIAANALTFAGPDYRIEGGSLTLESTNATIRADADAAIGTVLAGTNGWTKAGTAALTLLATNVYGGTTTVAAGTVELAGGNDRLPVGTTLAFAGSGAVDVGAASQTVSMLTVPDTALTAVLRGKGGALLLSGAGGLQLGPGGTLSGTQHVQVDMAGLDRFAYSASAGTMRVGLKAGAQNTAALGQVATVTLARTNAITAATLAIGDVAANSDGGQSTLRLGLHNAIHANTINCGYSGRSDTRLDFAAEGSSATVRGTDGVSPAGNWNVGNVATYATAAQKVFADIVDFSGGTLDARVGTIRIGSADAGTATSRGGTDNGSFTLGAGVLEVGTLIVGRTAGSGSIGTAYGANGVFTLADPGGLVRARTLSLAENTITVSGAYAKTVTGTFNLSNRGTLRAVTIQRGAQTGTAVATATLNWTDGTISPYDADSDLTVVDGVAVNLADTGTHAFEVATGRTATVYAALVGAGGTLTKAGAGALVLAGTNTYSGATTVLGGRLGLVGSGSLEASTPIVVAAGATLDASTRTDGTLVLRAGQTLTGDGTVTGRVVATSGASLEPGVGGGTFGTLTVAGDLAVINGGRMAFDLSGTATGVGGGTNDLLVVGGLLDLRGNGVVEIAFPTGNLAATPAVYMLMRYGTLAGSVSNLALYTHGGMLAVDETNRVISVEFSGEGAGEGDLVWHGDGASNRWDVGGARTWLNAGNADVFYPGDRATFEDTGTNIPAIEITGTVLPSAVVIDAVQNYTLGGAGEIGGAATLTQAGSGTLTILSTNTYGGGTTLKAGRLRVGNASAIGTGRLTVNGGGLSSDGTVARALAVPVTLNGACTIGDATDTGPITLSGGVTLATNVSITVPTGQAILHTLSGVIDDGDAAYGLTREGATGILLLSTANRYDGGTLIRAGRINAGNASAFGTGPVVAEPSGQAYLTLAGPFTNAFRIAGTGFDENAGQLGAIRLQGGAVVSGRVTLTGDARIGSYNSNGTVSGAIGEDGGARKLELGGPATGQHSGNPIRLTGTEANTYSGGTEIINAIVRAGKDGAFGTGAVALRGPSFNARIQLSDGVNVTNALSITGSPFVGTVGRGLLEVTGTDAATWSGPITIAATPSGGGHLHTDAGATLTLLGPITAATGFTQRTGNIVYAGGGSCASMGVTGVARLGATNGIATNAVVNLGLSAAATLDLNGFAQTVAGLTKGANGATVGNGSSEADATLTITGTATYAGLIADGVAGGTHTVSLVVNGGNFTLAGVNTYTGSTTVRGGTLQLRVAGAVSPSSALVLEAGTLTADTGDFALGTLAVGAGASTLDLGGGGVASFAASGAVPWTGRLNVTGVLSPTSLRVGTNATGLTAEQVSRISLNGRGATIDAAGYIVPRSGTSLFVR